MVLRSIVKIDEEKCTGCGLCIPACAEGALKIVDGKAKLVSDKYCDGLAACLGECPQGAITIEKREAEEFNEEAVEEHLKRKPSVPTVHHAHPIHQPCPSAQVMHFERNRTEKEIVKIPGETESMLTQWPVQLTLLPTNAPFFENADLLIAADCVPFAYANFHNEFLRGRKLVVGCPKLDDAEAYKKKLTEIFKQSNIKSVTVVNMEVPCCFRLYRLVKEALDSSGKTISLRQEIISIKGNKITGIKRKVSTRNDPHEADDDDAPRQVKDLV
ncbi:MAG: 4Fe-4S binding protein [Candidatus Bathyarchaeota archaeon]|nr:4Fe-4S binding protein [Candidatus Bathyarchaeota archaeon]MDH5623075.1 4Fe-4S binding protein [Candidatus Bathyarchaeota archaeon]MDH5635163.1 4Fe-4S binding protein [Candidatus Bathyarchaeota archaeon]MDH5701333.1 4Fe-4S binding protein [Candidatus Bathyarchaeota archaeon]